MSIEKLSPCKLSTLVSSVEGLSSNSASPIDAWIVTLKKPYKNINKLFLKIHLNPKFLNSELLGIDEKKLFDMKRKIFGLIYETNVCQKIINPLINNKICINFVKNLGSGSACNYFDLLDILLNKTMSDKLSILTDTECKHNLNRSIAFISVMDKDRPSINDIEPKIDDKISDELYEKYKNFKFNMLLNEVINGSFTFGEYIFKMKKTPIEFWSILFQLCAGCYAMSLSKTVHNDLHLNNIFLQKFEDDEYMLYYINDIPIVIKTRYKVYIYDFDRSYAESLGMNYLLTDETCRDTSQCNKYFENKDIIKILCNIYNTSKDIGLRNEILELISSNETIKKDIEKIYRHMSIHTGKIQCFLVNEKEESLTEDVFKKFNSTEQILFNIVEQLKIFGDFSKYISSVKKENISRCNKSYFNENGTLKM